MLAKLRFGLRSKTFGSGCARGCLPLWPSQSQPHRPFIGFESLGGRSHFNQKKFKKRSLEKKMRLYRVDAVRSEPLVDVRAKTDDQVPRDVADGHLVRKHEGVSPVHHLPVGFLRAFRTERGVTCARRQRNPSHYTSSTTKINETTTLARARPGNRERRQGQKQHEAEV